MDIPKLENLNASSCTERSIFLHYFEFWKYLNDNYPKELKWTEKLYWYYHGLTEYPKCKICGSNTKFINLKTGYREFCSYKCMNSCKDIQEKKKQTCIKKYGVSNPMYSDECKEKLKQTNLERFGVDNPFKSDEIKEKIKQTNLKNLGVEYPMQSENIRVKSKQTCLKKYGTEYSSSNENVKNTRKQTIKEKYGVDNLFQSDEIKEKSKQTCLEKYGVDNYNKTTQYRDMMNERKDEIQEKMEHTMLERYGVGHFSNPIKAQQTCLDLYGNISYTGTKECQDKINETKRKNGTFNTSKIEELLVDFFEHDAKIEFKHQYRSEEYPFNCDFYLPKWNLYIEIQGSWLHGGHPYDSNSSQDELTLEIWKSKETQYYNNAIETWTIRDPKKRQWAKDHNLNWVEIFSNDFDEVIRELEKLGIEF